MITERFSKCLRHWRRKRNLSQTQLSLKLGMSDSAVRKYEYENRLPSLTTLDAILNALGVTVGEFFEEAENNG